jgi:AraC-like DNA-binding protein
MQHVGRLIRSASLNGYVELVQSLGHDPHALLREVGLAQRLLDNPETLIPGGAVRALLEQTARATGTVDFALRLAARRSLSDLGLVSLMLQQEPTVRQALDTLCGYLRLLNASLVTRIEDAGDAVIIHEDLLPNRELPMRQSMELAVGVMFRTLRELVGPQWRPRQVCFTHRAPADAAAHRAFFGCLVLFNQGFNGLVCAAAELQVERPRQHQAIARFAREQLDAALRRRAGGLRESCRELVLALMPVGRCTAQQVAQQLRVDRRTLHRYLSTEGSGFSELLNQVRMEMVLQHLRESDLPLGEIAGLLGFATPSSFSHWFRAQFGCSVSAWRKAN